MANMKKTLTSILAIGVLVFLLLTTCTASDEKEKDRSRIYVTSLQENWGRVQAKALNWHSDAYLTGVIIPILVDSPRPGQSLLHAYFFSVSENQRMLDVVVDSDNTIHSETSPLVQPLADPPIMSPDWRIDSVDALVAMIMDKDVEYLLAFAETQCSTLTLEKTSNIAMEGAVWRILIHDCGMSSYLRKEYINAVSGEPVK